MLGQLVTSGQFTAAFETVSGGYSTAGIWPGANGVTARLQKDGSVGGWPNYDQKQQDFGGSNFDISELSRSMSPKCPPGLSWLTHFFLTFQLGMKAH